MTMGDASRQSGSSIRDGDSGKQTGVDGICKPVPLPEDHEALQLFRAITDASGDAVGLSDPQGRLVYANPALTRLVGPNALGTLACGGPGSVGAVTGIPPGDAFGRGSDGWHPFYHHVSFPIDTAHGTYYGSIIHDAAGLFKAEEAYRALIDNSLQGFCIYLSTSRRLVAANQAFADITGYSVPELLALDPAQFLEDIVHPDDRDQVRAVIRMRVEWKNAPGRFEFRFIRRDGKMRWVEAHVNVIDYGGDRAIHGGLIDITDRKRVEEYKRYRELLDNMADGVVIIDAELRVIEVNEVVTGSIGYSREEFTGKRLPELIKAVPGSSLERFYTAARERREGTFEVEIVLPNGRMLLEINARPVIYRNRGCYLCVSRNITETRRLQQQLILSERLAATGQLAASVAHEINSPLQAITILLEDLEQIKPDDPGYHEDLGLLTNAIEGIGNTVKHLLDLNRPGTQYKQQIQVNTVVEQTAALVRGSLRRHNITLKLNLSRSVPFINASPQQLSQVLLNLINNAIEAMTVSAAASGSLPAGQGSGRPQITIATSASPEGVAVRVTDNGPGIPADVLPRVFEPFVTMLKPAGTGIGLSVCQSIMHEHGGSISVHNMPRGGAVFELLFPLNHK